MEEGRECYWTLAILRINLSPLFFPQESELDSPYYRRGLKELEPGFLAHEIEHNPPRGLAKYVFKKPSNIGLASQCVKEFRYETNIHQ